MQLQERKLNFETLEIIVAGPFLLDAPYVSTLLAMVIGCPVFKLRNPSLQTAAIAYVNRNRRTALELLALPDRSGFTAQYSGLSLEFARLKSLVEARIL